MDWGSVHVEMHDCGVGGLFIEKGGIEVCVKAKCD